MSAEKILSQCRGIGLAAQAFENVFDFRFARNAERFAGIAGDGFADAVQYLPGRSVFHRTDGTPLAARVRTEPDMLTGSRPDVTVVAGDPNRSRRSRPSWRPCHRGISAAASTRRSLCR